ncbi:hypothetical protein ACFOEY_17415 [Paracandidimonas soli]|uniref:hypothetical protein n=1 Tax=Paracandidimonas soli TaxID=1917182 RepID=UPI00360C734C
MEFLRESPAEGNRMHGACAWRACPRMPLHAMSVWTASRNAPASLAGRCSMAIKMHLHKTNIQASSRAQESVVHGERAVCYE